MEGELVERQVPLRFKLHSISAKKIQSSMKNTIIYAHSHPLTPPPPHSPDSHPLPTPSLPTPSPARLLLGGDEHVVEEEEAAHLPDALGELHHQPLLHQLSVEPTTQLHAHRKMGGGVSVCVKDRGREVISVWYEGQRVCVWMAQGGMLLVCVWMAQGGEVNSMF